MQDLKLAASASNWRLFMVRRADKAFRAIQEKIFQAQGYTCQFCGFCSKHFFETVNLDGNFLNNKRSNLATACPFCTQCYFLESIGQSDFGAGTLILLPEITQGQLNALCHVAFGELINSTSLQKPSKNVYRGLKLRSQQVEKQLGEGMSTPSVYARMLVDAQGDHIDNVHQDLSKGLRLLPLVERFSYQLEAWSVEALETLT